MSSVDERIVEMTFDNQQFETGVKQSMKSLASLEEALSLDGAKKGLTQAGAGITDLCYNKISAGATYASNFVNNKTMAVYALIQRYTNKIADFFERTIKSFTIEPPMTGWNKYEEKTTAVQTIIAATGKSIDEVNESLNKLNWFTDETSYNFTDMINNIGKFTSMGIDLDEAVTAMQGISTWASVSGQGVAEAGRVMYNLSQAMGQGSVKLMDWKSIENANMGTKEFKQTVLDTARAMGKLKDSTVTVENFSQSLSKGWFTKDVLMAVLQQYGGFADEVYKLVEAEGLTAAEAIERLSTETMTLGEKAFRAAQEAKTFTEVLASVKDAVSTGWMQTFEYIFGNYDEAKSMWTDLANFLYDVFAEGGNARNELLEEWHDMGGRELALQGIYNAFEALGVIIQGVKEAFHDIIPEATVDQFMWLSQTIADFGLKAKGFAHVFTRLNSVEFKWVEDAFDKGIEFTEAFGGGTRGDEVKQMQERLIQLGYDLGEAGADGIWGPKTQAALETFQKEAGVAFSGIFDEETSLALMSKITELFGGHWEEERDEYNQYSKSMERVMSIVRGLAAVVKIAGTIIKTNIERVKIVLDALSPIAGAIVDVLAFFGDKLAEISGVFTGDGVTDSLTLFGKAMEPLKNWAEGAANSIRKFFGVIEAEEGHPTLTKVLDSLKSWGASAVSWIKGWIPPGLVQNARQRLISAFGIEEGDNWFDIVSKVFNKITGAVGTAFNFVRTKITTLFSGSDVKGSFKNWLTEVVGIDSSDSTQEKIVKLFEGVKTTLSSVWEKLKQWLQTTFGETAFGKKAVEIFNTVKTFIVTKFEAVKASLSTFFSGKDQNGSFLNWITNLFGSFKNGDIKEKLSGAFETAKTAILGAMSSFKTWLFGLFGNRGIAESGAGESVNGGAGGSSGGSAGGGSSSGAAIAESIVDGMATGFVDTLDDKKATLGDVIKGAFKSIGGWITSAFSGAGKLIQKIITPLQEGSIDLSSLIGNVSGIAVAILAIMPIFKSMSVLGNSALALKNFSDSLWEVASAKKIKSLKVIGNILLKAALAIALVAGVVYVFAGMELEDLAKGFGFMAGIVLLLVGLLIVAAKATKVDPKGLGSVITGLIGVAACIAVMGIVIKQFAAMEWSAFANGIMMLGITLLALAGFIKLTGKISVDPSSAKQTLSAAVGMMAMVVALALAVALVSFVEPGQLLKAGVVIFVLSNVLVLMNLAMSRMKTTTGGALAPLTSSLAIIILIGSLCAAMLIVSSVKPTTLLKGIVVINLIKAVLKSLNRSMAQMSTSIGGAVSAITSALGILILIGGFALLMRTIKGASLRDSIVTINAMMLMMIAMVVSLRVLGNAHYEKGTVIKTLLMMLPIIALIVAVSWALTKLQQAKVKPKSIIGLTVGLSAIFVSMALLFKASKGLTRKDAFAAGVGTFAVLGAVTAIVGLVVGIAGLLNQFQGAGNWVKGGFKFLGEAIGEFVGSMQAASFNAFGEGINAFGEAMEGVDVNQSLGDKTSKAIEVATMISTFASGLPQVTWSEVGMKLANWLSDDKDGESSALGIFSKDMSTFATGFSNFAAAMGSLDIDVSEESELSKKTEGAVAIAKMISTFANGLPQVDMATVANRLAIWITDGQGSGSSLSTFAQDIDQFATSFKTFADTMGTFDVSQSSGLSDKTNAALAVAGLIKTFATELPELDAATVASRFASWLQNEGSTGSALGIFSSDMSYFATAFSNFATEMSKLDLKPDSDLNTKTNAAIKIAQPMARLAKGLPAITITDALMLWMTGGQVNSPLDVFSRGMVHFAKAFNNFAKEADKIETPSADLDTKTDAMTKIAGYIKVLAEGLPEATLANALITWATDGDSNGSALEMFGKGMESFAIGFKAYTDYITGDEFSSVEIELDKDGNPTGKLADATQFLIGIAGYIKTLAEGLPDITYADVLSAMFTGDNSPLSAFATGMASFATGFAEYQNAISGVTVSGADLEKAGLVVDILNMFKDVLLALIEVGVTNGIEVGLYNPFDVLVLSLQGIMNNIVALNDQYKDVDTTKIESIGTFMSGLAGIANTIDTIGTDAAALDGKTFAENINRFVSEANANLSTEDLSTMTDSISTQLSSLKVDFGSAALDTSGISSMMTEAMSTIAGYADAFATTGKYLDQGLATGIKTYKLYPVSAIIQVVKQCNQAARDTAQIKSPSRVFAEIGMYLDQGLAQGIDDYSKVVTDSSGSLATSVIDTTKGALANFSSALTDSMDSDPVIRPVVDLTNVANGARQINSMMSAQQAVGISASTSSSMAGAVQAKNSANTKNQNGSSSKGSGSSINTGVNLSGNNFYIKDEKDVRSLASEIAMLVKSQQRAFGG